MDVNRVELGTLDIGAACSDCIALVGTDPDTREVMQTEVLFGDEEGRLEKYRVTINDDAGNRAMVDVPTEGRQPGRECTRDMQTCNLTKGSELGFCGAGLARVYKKSQSRTL